VKSLLLFLLLIWLWQAMSFYQGLWCCDTAMMEGIKPGNHRLPGSWKG